MQNENRTRGGWMSRRLLPVIRRRESSDLVSTFEPETH